MMYCTRAAMQDERHDSISVKVLVTLFKTAWSRISVAERSFKTYNSLLFGHLFHTDNLVLKALVNIL